VIVANAIFFCGLEIDKNYQPNNCTAQIEKRLPKEAANIQKILP